MMMGNFYQLNRQSRWAIVGIPGIGHASLMKSVGGDASVATDSRFLHPITDGKPEGYFSFAVWQDPVERFASLCRQFDIEHRSPGRHPSPLDADTWIERAASELAKPCAEQSGHFRRQSDIYRPADVDAIVKMDDLPQWIESRGWGRICNANPPPSPEPYFSPVQVNRIRALYAADEVLATSTLRVSAGKPVVTGLWIGKSIPPLAELCMRSYLDHGFHFRLMTYGYVAGVPEGVEIIDANSILPQEMIYTHPTGSLAPFADWLRYRLLADHGGMWTDMDMACLRPFRMGEEPWFALESANTASNSFLKFPKNHPIPTLLAAYAEDPGTPMPWDGVEELREKEDLRRYFPDLRDRRVGVRWGAAGPGEFTKALKHFGVFHLAAPASSMCPIPWGSWRSGYNGNSTLNDSKFRNSLTVHFWGEMLRLEPNALWNPSPKSILLTLMDRHRCLQRPTSEHDGQTTMKSARILVGICSSRNNTALRQAIRETWLSTPHEGIEAVFFVGDSETPLENEVDVWCLPTPDNPLNHPEKVRAFFRRALASSEFDWLFNCDDATYLSLGRLRDLIGEDFDLVGNGIPATEGFPNARAGYLLSRHLVELLAADPALLLHGKDEALIGKAAIAHGARALATKQLCPNASRFPRPDNEVVASHGGSPERLRAIHSVTHSAVQEERRVEHPHWTDHLIFYASGFYRRKSTPCMGTWVDEGEVRRIKWFNWGEEYLVPVEKPDQPGASLDGNQTFRCLKKLPRVITVELRGGIGNQMFQYAHALALADRFQMSLKVSYANYGRRFGLGIFGIELDGWQSAPFEWISYEGDFREGQEWPTAAAIKKTKARCLRLNGYFQNEKFFLGMENEVRERFRISARPIPETEGRIPVCLHVRRGDFVGSPSHEVCTESYYLSAMKIMRGIVDNPLFIVVSDDAQWCQAHFASLPDTWVMDDQTEQQALETMGACQAFILSNSTFGWWGAWLANANPVIAPNRFLNGRAWNICPDRWITLPSDSPRPNEQPI